MTPQHWNRYFFTFYAIFASIISAHFFKHFEPEALTCNEYFQEVLSEYTSIARDHNIDLADSTLNPKYIERKIENYKPSLGGSPKIEPFWVCTYDGSMNSENQIEYKLFKVEHIQSMLRGKSIFFTHESFDHYQKMKTLSYILNKKMGYLFLYLTPLIIWIIASRKVEKNNS